MDNKAWKVSNAGVTTGPFSDDEIKQQLRSGQISSDSSVWRDGWPDWKPISSVFSNSINSSPPPPPHRTIAPAASKKSPVKKAIGCGCGSILLLIILVAIFKPDSPPSSSRTGTTGSTGATDPTAAVSGEEAEARAAAEAYAMGTPFQLGDFNYTIANANTVPSLGNQFINEAAAAGATFVIVTYTIENTGNETATAMSSDFYLNDAKGRKFTTSSRAETALAMSGDKSQDFIVSQLQPGVPKQAKQVFEIPIASTQEKGLVLVIPEKGFMGTGKATIPLN